jgi:cell division control protein 12
LDIEAMKHLSQRVNLIPIIAKADTLSATKLSAFKDRIRSLIFDNSISVYTCPLESDDEETTKRNVEVMSAMPFAVIGSTDEVERADGKKVLGRKYPWGVAEVENEKHSDFKHLRSLLVRTHMQDLIQTTEEIHYENYRLNRLQNRDDLVDPSAMEK